MQRLNEFLHHLHTVPPFTLPLSAEMKRTKPVFILALLLGNAVFAQNQYEVLAERPNEKTLKGIISRQALENDTSFKWYAENLQGYTPNTKALEGLKKNADSVQIVAFMGTWCGDSHAIIPKFFSLTDAAGFPANKITLVGVDRAKTTSGHLAEALNVKNVPTLIFFKEGKELGRVVEYGKYGLFDKEIGEILQ